MHDLAQASLPHRSCVVPNKPNHHHKIDFQIQHKIIKLNFVLPTQAATFVSQTDIELHWPGLSSAYLLKKKNKQMIMISFCNFQV